MRLAAPRKLSRKAHAADIFADEYGSDLSALEDLFDQVLGLFKNESEEVRSAAAFAAGEFASDSDSYPY